MKENMLCIYKPINDHMVVAPLPLPISVQIGLTLIKNELSARFTRRCICSLGSLVSRVDNCTPQRILWNSIMDPKRESRPANVPMNAVSIKHPLAAQNHTRSEHNSKRIIDHGSILIRVGHRQIRVVLSIFYMPSKNKRIKLIFRKS